MVTIFVQCASIWTCLWQIFNSFKTLIFILPFILYV